MRIPSVINTISTILPFTGAVYGLNSGANRPASAAISPPNIQSLMQAMQTSNNTAEGKNLLRQARDVNHSLTIWRNAEGNPTVSTNADLCQHSSTYQCVGSTVTYGINSSADLTAYVFSSDSGVNIFQDDIDSFAMAFAQAAVANAENDVNHSTSATLAAYSQDGELVASVAVSDPDMQLIQLKAVRALLKNTAVPDGRVVIIVEDTIINDDGYSQDDDYSYSYAPTSDPLMLPLAVAAGALMVESIVVCVLAICLYYSCKRENGGAVSRDESASGLLGNDAPTTRNGRDLELLERGEPPIVALTESASASSLEPRSESTTSVQTPEPNTFPESDEDHAGLCLIS